MKKILILTFAAFCLAAAACEDDDKTSPTTISFDKDDKNKQNQGSDTDSTGTNTPDVNTDTTQVNTDTTQVNTDTTQVDPNQGQTVLDDTKFLKDYINRAAHPIFKFSGALDVGEFHNNNNGVRDTVAAHFDEIVAGNAMKYGSVVGGDGSMNFSRVKQFCSDAQAAGLTIYGHTLAWHSQQQPGYLLGLMADKEVVDPNAEPVLIKDLEQTYSNMSSYTMWHGEFQNADYNVDYDVSISNGLLHCKNNKEAADFYRVQYFVADNIPTKTGGNYDVTLKIKGSQAGTITFVMGGWSKTFNTKFDITEEMSEVTIHVDNLVEGGGHAMLQSGDFVGDIWVESIVISHLGNETKVPLTAEEKRDTLKWAMDHWIQGMMEATNGFVTAWDAVNEALTGGDSDGDGICDLQNYENNNISDPSNVSSGVFYWQAFMGDLEYVRTVVASARKHFKGNPDDLKLFINDYNLESDWDDNWKVKSLVEWVKRWEADGVTKIDGLGTQMHISCYENAQLQKSAEDHIVKMFQIMANSGKLVRVSELDMGYVRGNNKWAGSLKTSQVTEAEHKKMADFYKFIIKKYFEIVPPAQQYGFCQWCLTDAPSYSGWRGGEPVGIWTEGFKKRKEVYRGFAEGLAEIE